MVITLSVFLWIYGICAAIFAGHAFFNFFHLIKFGVMDMHAFIMTALFIGGMLLIIYITAAIALNINWALPLVSIGSSPPDTGL